MPLSATYPMGRTLLLGCIALLAAALVSCSGAATPTMTGQSATSPASSQHNVSSASNTSAGGSNASAGGSNTSTSQQKNSSVSIGPQYLIKTLNVTMQVKDTRKVADDLQTWIGTTDPRSSSAGIKYEQTGDNNNLYNISMNFSVQASSYTQIERYLQDYAPQHSGHLLSLNESVQDVTNDYVDTQSRLTNLRGEQARILDLLSHAQALGDIITIQDKLTDVEGQIENIEEHLKTLNDQTTFYTISIALQPAETGVPSKPGNSAWDAGQIFHDAFASSLSFAEALITFFIWILAYSVYIVPTIAIILLILRWRGYWQRPLPPPAN